MAWLAQIVLFVMLGLLIVPHELPPYLLGAVVGAVSGGCVEGAVIEVAEEILAGAEPRLLHFGIADSEAWDVGLPCGGEIDVWVERWEG